MNTPPYFTETQKAKLQLKTAMFRKSCQDFGFELIEPSYVCAGYRVVAPDHPGPVMEVSVNRIMTEPFSVLVELLDGFQHDIALSQKELLDIIAKYTKMNIV